MAEITSKILGIKKTNGEISLSDENIDRGPNGKILQLRTKSKTTNKLRDHLCNQTQFFTIL